MSIPIPGADAAVPSDSGQVGFTPLADSDIHDFLARIARSTAPARAGKVFLVGAGPGDPDLLTIKGARCLPMADAILFDGIGCSALLHLCRADAQRIDVSKRKGSCERTQEEIISILIAMARAGQTVVRLKNGDPLIFGRGGEEARALQRAGIPFEIVPGVSCVAAVPAYAGIPITDRDYSASFGVYSARRRGGLSYTDDEWRRIAQRPDTLIFLMGKTRCDLVVAKMVQFGRPATTPVAIIFDGTTPKQQTVVGTMATIVGQTQAKDVPCPGLIVVDNAVNARNQMNWFETGAAEQARDGRSKCPAE